MCPNDWATYTWSLAIHYGKGGLDFPIAGLSFPLGETEVGDSRSILLVELDFGPGNPYKKL
jgi:hypothetical protein